MSTRQKSNWPLLAGVAGVAAAIAIVGGIFAKSSQSGAQTSTTTTAKPEPMQPTTPPSAVAVVAPSTKQVALAVVPQEAHVFDGETDLGTSPVLLSVEPGKPLKLSARMEGYKDLELSIDGESPRESVKLERLPVKTSGFVPRPQPKKTPDPPKTEPKKKKTGMGGGEIVNPWD